MSKNRRKMVSVVLCVLGVSLWFGDQISAAVLEVGSGKTYATIQAAVDEAYGGTLVYSNHSQNVPGDEIIVYAGTYAGFTVVGNNMDCLTIRAYKDPADCASVAERVIITSPVNFNNWTEANLMQGFYLANTHATSATLQSISCARTSTFRNMVIYGGSSAALYGYSTWGTNRYEHCTVLVLRPPVIIIASSIILPAIRVITAILRGPTMLILIRCLFPPVRPTSISCIYRRLRPVTTLPVMAAIWVHCPLPACPWRN